MTELPVGLGFGCYRISDSAEQHRAAVNRAWDLGCRLFDTASNYMGGASERLLGAVLGQRPDADDLALWTKAGYVGSELGARLGDVRVLPLSPDAGYSLAPEVICASLRLSLERMNRERIDALFLHNPENLFAVDDPDPARRLQDAMSCCEQLVADGLINHYGISSSALVATTGVSRNGFGVLSLAALAGSVTSDHHLRLLQMPCNLLETTAARAGSDGCPSLIANARDAKFHLTANRPLNALRNGTSVRLAEYSTWAAPDISWREAWTRFQRVVTRQLSALDPDLEPFAFPVMRFLRDASSDLPHPDFVDEVFSRRVIPFFKVLFDGDVPADALQTLSELSATARAAAQGRLTVVASEVRDGLRGNGVLDPVDTRPLALIAAEFPLTLGFDCVLVGMRAPRYVDQLAPLLPNRP